jgi:DNA-binding HxlR family transcriptional regulator
VGNELLPTDFASNARAVDCIESRRQEKTVSDICQSRHRGNPESVAANKLIDSFKNKDRVRIMAMLKYVGPLTCKELEVELQLKHQTCSARLSELKADGWVIKTGGRREGAAEVRAVTAEERNATKNNQLSLEMGTTAPSNH